jgi:hypothetical protein
MSEKLEQYAKALKDNFSKMDTDSSNDLTPEELKKFTADSSQDKLAREAAGLLSDRFFEATMLADSKVERLYPDSSEESMLVHIADHNKNLLPGLRNPYSRTYYENNFGGEEYKSANMISKRDIEVFNEVAKPKSYYERQAQFRKWELGLGIAAGAVGYPVTAAIAVAGTMATVATGFGSGGLLAPIAGAVLGAGTFIGTYEVGKETLKRTRGVVNSESEAIGSEWQWRQDMIARWENDKGGFKRVR